MWWDVISQELRCQQAKTQQDIMAFVATGQQATYIENESDIIRNGKRFGYFVIDLWTPLKHHAHLRWINCAFSKVSIFFKLNESRKFLGDWVHLWCDTCHLTCRSSPVTFWEVCKQLKIFMIVLVSHCGLSVMKDRWRIKQFVMTLFVYVCSLWIMLDCLMLLDVLLDTTSNEQTNVKNVEIKVGSGIPSTPLPSAMRRDAFFLMRFFVASCFVVLDKFGCVLIHLARKHIDLNEQSVIWLLFKTNIQFSIIVYFMY